MCKIFLRFLHLRRDIFIDKTPLEKNITISAKKMLGMGRNSTILTARAEFGRSPIEKYIALQTVKY